MRLYDRAMRDGVAVPRFPADPHPLMAPPPPAPIKVIADQPMMNFWSSTNEAPWGASDFGIIKPPYPSMWIEGNMPDRSFAVVEREGPSDDGWCNTRGWQRGYHVTEGPSTVDIRMVLWAPGRTRRVVSLPYFHRFTHNDGGERSQGTYAPMLGVVEVEGVPFEPWVEWLGEYGAYLTLDCDVALYALSLMNCRNVSVEEVPRNEKLAKAHKKRHGVPLSRYSRIVLPNQSRGGGGRGGGGATAKHLVRGHFKTYTEDAPLMGRHVGTYWWGWHARGDAELGTVTPEYHVKPPEEGP